MSLFHALALVALSLSVDGYDPTPVERPQAPGRGNAEVILVPSTAELGRDTAIADRFTAENQGVIYLMRARAGELSLLTLDTVGYARGWQSSAKIQIRAAQGGETLVERTRAGGTVYRMFLPFQAPADGLYEVELTCPKQYFRYVLTRNSQFRLRPVEPYAIGDRSFLHGYLRDPETDIARYALDLEENQEVLLTVLSDETSARQRDFARRQQAADRGELDLLRGERLPPAPQAGGRGAARGATIGDHPDYYLRIIHDSREPVSPTPFTRFRAPKKGTYIVEILANGPGEGGFFELSIERSPVTVAGSGFVDDADGDPVLGVDLQFFREPGLEYFGRASTDSEGRWTLDLPAGSYTVFLQASGGTLTNVRTTVDADRETNFIYGARDPEPPMDK